MKPVFLHAANPGAMTGAGNWTYLIDGRSPLLIDAGVGHVAHLDSIAKAAPLGPSRVVVTHAHSDHVSGAPAIHQRWPAAAFLKYPWPGRDPDLPLSALAEGSIVSTGDGDLTVLHTPGHSPDHVCLWHQDSRTLFVGDMLVQGSTVVIPASHGGSLVEYLRSLERLRQLDAARALPAHGPVIEDPGALIAYYIQHRVQREAQVIDALATPSTVAAIVATIYPALIEALLPMARDSVLAHLLKLESEGRVSRHGEQWSAVR